MGVILGAGWMRNLLGARLLNRMSECETQRGESDRGWTVDGEP